MFPLKDENPSQSFPHVTLGLLAVNTLIWLYQLGLSPQGEWLFVHRFGVIPAAMFHLIDPFPHDGLPLAAPLLTSMFMHGGLFHLASNMIFLWIFGNNLEDALGSFRFALFYLLSGLVAALAHILTNVDSVLPLIGASGAVAGVMGGYFLLFPRARILTLFFIIFYPILVWIPAVFFLLIWLGLQIINASAGGDQGVAWTAHIGGFIFGLILVKLMGTRKGFVSALSDPKPVQPRPGRTLH